MNKQTTKNSSVDDEVDLLVVFGAIKKFLLNILKLIISVFVFFYRHKFVLIGIILVGILLGYIYDKNTEKTYKNDLLVLPNFKSADYVYKKVEFLESKLSEKDTIFLIDMFGKDYNKVSYIKIEPVLNVNDIIDNFRNSEEILEILLEENGGIDFTENPLNTKSFEFHHLYIGIKGKEKHEFLTNKFINFLNSNAYFNDLKKASQKTLKLQLSENQIIINQIDSLIKYSQKSEKFDTNFYGVNVTDNNGLKELLEKKERLLAQKYFLESKIVNETDIVKLVDVNYKILDNEEFFKKSKIKLFPLLLVIIYSLIFLFRYIARKAQSVVS